MPRTVRISPVPIPPPPVEPRRSRPWRGAVGVALLLAAVAFGLGHVLLSGSGSHSYDRTATPPAQVRLTSGTSYFLSTRDGPGAVPAADPLTCTYTPVGGAPAGLAITAVTVDSRATHAVASFTAPVSGVVTVGCAGGAVGSRPVFVDDADDAPADVAGWLLLLAVLAAVPGVGLTLGALAARSGATRVSGVTADPSP